MNQAQVIAMCDLCGRERVVLDRIECEEEWRARVPGAHASKTSFAGEAALHGRPSILKLEWRSVHLPRDPQVLRAKGTGTIANIVFRAAIARHLDPFPTVDRYAREGEIEGIAELEGVERESTTSGTDWDLVPTPTDML